MPDTRYELSIDDTNTPAVCLPRRGHGPCVLTRAIALADVRSGHDVRGAEQSRLVAHSREAYDRRGAADRLSSSSDLLSGSQEVPRCSDNRACGLAAEDAVREHECGPVDLLTCSLNRETL